jgi:hypothetical protein
MNALRLIRVSFAAGSNDTVTSDLQPKKQKSGMQSTKAGMQIDSNAEHP